MASTGISSLVSTLDALPEPPRRITLDITTVTKQYLLVLLRTLRAKLPGATVRALYTPARYPSFMAVRE